VRFPNSDLIEKHHFLIAVNAIEEIRDQIPYRHLVLNRDKEHVLRTRKEPRGILHGRNRITVSGFKEPDRFNGNGGFTRTEALNVQ